MFIRRRRMTTNTKKIVVFIIVCIALVSVIIYQYTQKIKLVPTIQCEVNSHHSYFVHKNNHEPKPDCMLEQFQRTSGSSLMKGRISDCNLCEHYHGRLNQNCVYKHPNVVHYVKLSKENSPNVLSFQELLSIVSVDKFYKPDEIVIHSNNLVITGLYWEKLQDLKLKTPINIRHIERVKSIGKDHAKPWFITHEADYIKVSTCYKEGGIFMDFDAVILNGTKLRQMQEKAEVVVGTDKTGCFRLNAGCFSCVPGSNFVKMWQDGYENDYWPLSWTYNAGDYPAEILCQCPSKFDIFVDVRMANFDEVQKWLHPGEMNWKDAALVHYINRGFMDPLLPPSKLLNMDTPFTDMIKYVLGNLTTEF